MKKLAEADAFPHPPGTTRNARSDPTNPYPLTPIP